LSDVLIVLKSDVLRQSLGDLFLAENYGCVVAADGREAVEAFRTRHPQLLITDLHLGPEIIEQVRQEDEDVAVIIVSGSPIQQGVIATLKRSAYYLMTPCDPEELFLIVERALERRQLLIERRWCQEHHGDASRPAALP